jgi:hypothetical protein
MNRYVLTRVAIALLAAAASAPAAYGAHTRHAALSGNLIKNGNAELGPAVSNDSSSVASITGWSKTGEFTVVKYGSPGGFPDASVSTQIQGGRKFFAGGPANPDSGATQTINVARFATAIDAGKVTATLSGDMGGFSAQRDSLTVTASFLDASGRVLSVMRIGPVTSAQRHGTTGLIPRITAARVHPKTRTVRIDMRAVRTDGSYNDGYADNLSLKLT